MALIWRGIFEVDDPAFATGAANAMQAWLRWKLREPLLDLPLDGSVVRHDSNEVVARTAEQDALGAFRGWLYEQNGAEQLRTTLTVLRGGGSTWAWVDLERWSGEAFVEPWTPIAPSLVSTLLRERCCFRGPVSLSDRPRFVEGDEGGDLARAVLDETRDLPYVVVSPGRNEPRDGSALERRAIQLQRRLAGIAPVAVLQPGAVSVFSRVVTDELGEGFDVYGGAIRTYLPGPLDDHGTYDHRIVPFHRIRGRHPNVVADMIAAPIQRGACAQPPPTMWREELRALLEPTQLSDDEIQEELLRLEREKEQERTARARLERTLESERESAADVERDNDDLRRRLAWLKRQLEQSGAHPELPPSENTFDPDFCGEVPEAAAGLPHLAFPEAQWEDADELDTHVSGAWAKRAWRACKAMSSYAVAKAAGEFDGNFRDYCGDGRDEAIPRAWIALSESETTNNNDRFRALRELPIDPAVTGAETVYMPAHIKIVAGGYPAPRIHFHDDTGGVTGKVHIGYFGQHLDNKSKS